MSPNFKGATLSELGNRTLLLMETLWFLKVYTVHPYTCIFSPRFLPNFRDFFQKWGLLIKERIRSDRSKFFPLWDDPNLHGSNNENDRVTSPENVPIPLNVTCTYCYVRLSVAFCGAPVAQWVKRWPTDLAVASSSPARGGIFSAVNGAPFAHSLSLTMRPSS